MSNTLTPKQKHFCLAYIETGNASEAYRLAYSAENMKPETINVKASELLANGKIAVRVKEIQAEHQKRHDVTMDDILCELGAVGFSNIADYFNQGSNGTLEFIGLDKLARNAAAAISEIVITETVGGAAHNPTTTRTTKIKLHPKIPALIKLGEHMGGFVENVHVKGEMKHTIYQGLPEEVQQELNKIFEKHGRCKE